MSLTQFNCIEFVFWSSFLLLFISFGIKCIRYSYPKGFISFSSMSAGGATESISTSNFFDDNCETHHSKTSEFYKLCNEIFNDEIKTAQINVDNVFKIAGILYISGRGGQYWTIPFNDKPLEPGKKLFHINEIKISGNCFLIIDKIKIGRIIIDSCFTGKVQIHNSWINSLVIEKKSKLSSEQITNKGNSDYTREVIISSANIAVLNLNDECCDSLSLIDSAVSFINYKSEDKNSHCVNSLYIGDSNICTTKSISFLQSPQGYRTLRAKVKDRCDQVTEHSIYACELKLERCTQKKLYKFCDYIYDIVSNYGTSPTKTILWSFAVISFSVSISLLYNLVNVPLGKQYDRAMYLEMHNSGFYVYDLYYAFILSIQYIFNPTSFFSSATMIRSTNAIFDLWLFVQSFIIYILIAILFLSIRRRYRASQ